ncbi:hypothetical protein [Micromonospora sp. NPDC023737]|uniref:hypothetical protein n=1 Tax=unclassified Micromonospora TaxID=2617518 RepID=UPI00340410BB
MPWTETAQAWAAIGAAAASVIALTAVVVQLRHLSWSLQTTARGATYNIGVRLKDVFIEHPHLRPYFFENRPVPADHPEYGRIATIAELCCIYLQEIAAQSRNVSTANRAAWFSLLRSLYESSPPVRSQLENHMTWYSEELRSAVRVIRADRVETPARRPETQAGGQTAPVPDAT